MLDIVYRYDPSAPTTRKSPADSGEAVEQLLDGNREFASLVGDTPAAAPVSPRIIPFDLADLGIAADGGAPRQQPFAVVLGCSDARVPAELIFNRACNELFVVRVAGNVLGAEPLGSIDYAVQSFPASLKLLVVLGHSQCGAVTAAIDAFLTPAKYLAFSTTHHLRSIVNSLFPAVRASVAALAQAWGEGVAAEPGYRRALTETAVVVNAALTASILRQEFADQSAGGVRAVFGVYDLVTRRVRVPLAPAVRTDDEVRLEEPPVDTERFRELGVEIARSDFIRRLLRGKKARTRAAAARRR
jgi:carbonic anhydrase